MREKGCAQKREICEGDGLALAINLAFSCSLRLGELMGLTWDCVDIDEDSIRKKNASIYIDKQLQRVSKNSLKKLDNKVAPSSEAQQVIDLLSASPDLASQLLKMLTIVNNGTASVV